MTLVKLNLSGHRDEELEELGFIFPGVLHVNLEDIELPYKVTTILKEYVNSGDTVEVVMPGLAPLACIVLTVIHGLSGTFPKLIPFIRVPEENYVLGKALDLHSIRNEIARSNRKEVIIL